MARLNWNHRQGPDDFDATAPQPVRYDFDHHRCLEQGKPSWPDKFGPSVVTKAWKAGLVVVAEVEGIPYPVAAAKTRWAAAGVIEVECLEGWKVPSRLWTRPNAKGLTSSGLLIED